MRSLSVIILSYALDDEIYQMNRHTLESLLRSEEWSAGMLDVVLMESNKENLYQYDDIFVDYIGKVNFRIEIPQEKFGFHRFLNLGILHTNGELVAMCNNDIEFQRGWYSAIMAVKMSLPEFMCFSPLDRSYPLMSEDSLPSSKPYYIGWENKKHFAAWCFVWERKVLNTIGLLDEQFDFYSADDDELQTLRYWAIPNVVVTGSEVKHLSQIVTHKVDQIKSPVIPQEMRNQYPLTDGEIKRGLTWLWEDERFYVAYQRMKSKWGNEHTRERVNRLLERYPLLNRRCVTKMLYDKRVVNLLAVLTRAKG